jgi:acetyltransferase
MVPSRSSLEVFFKPKQVAVIGASETMDSVGRTILWNLISTPFGGTVFPVNPKRPSVLGIKAYPSIAAVPQKVDLAVIVTPASSVHGLVEECVASGVKGVIPVSRKLAPRVWNWSVGYWRPRTEARFASSDRTALGS